MEVGRGGGEGGIEVRPMLTFIIYKTIPFSRELRDGVLHRVGIMHLTINMCTAVGCGVGEGAF